ncbi:hypothetical protein KSP40_PGU021742 [Platanthera guangdongensis]|uniref:Remorin C-terminal domain-containing protein n=1 Tax=Platanthera guangdongensis TaxID=2320717 RepID=A0ABR2LV74_9ASPA
MVLKRKLEEKRTTTMEKMQKEFVNTRWKAEEKRVSVEAKRGIEVARVLEVANLLRAVGCAPWEKPFPKSEKKEENSRRKKKEKKKSFKKRKEVVQGTTHSFNLVEGEHLEEIDQTRSGIVVLEDLISTTLVEVSRVVDGREIKDVVEGEVH